MPEIMQPDELFERAREARRRGALSGAVEALEQLIAARPSDLAAIFERALILQDLGRIEEARGGYMEVTRLVAGHVPALMRLGQLARQDGNRGQSLKYFQSAALAKPDHLDAQMQVAYDLCELGRLDEAEIAFLRVLDTAPTDPGALMGLGYLSRAQGDRGRSLSFFQRAAVSHPEQPDAHLQVAYDLRELGRRDEAKSAFLRVLELAPDHVGALAALGYLARQEDQRVQSLAYFRRAVEADPSHVDANLQVAYDLRELGEIDTATKQFERVLTLSPGHEPAARALEAIAQQRHGRAAGTSERSGKGERAVEQAIEARMRQGYQACNSGRFEDAERIFAHVLGLAPHHAPALSALGHIARIRSDIVRSLGFFVQVADADPRDADAAAQVAHNLYELGRQEEADKACARALALLDHVEHNVGVDPSMCLKRFDLLVQAGNFDGASTFARATADRARSNAWLWSREVQFAINLGDRDTVVQLFENSPEGTTSFEKSQVSFTKGLFAESRGQLKSAIDFYHEALALNALAERARFSLARVLLQTFDIDAARAVFGPNGADSDPVGPNADQRYLSKLIDEIALFKELPTIAAALPVVRIRLLRQLILVNRDQTAPAVLLLWALREAGLLGHVATQATKSSLPRVIPKRIVQFWPEAETPADLLMLLQLWQKRNSGYECVAFNDTSARELIAAHFSSDVLQVYSQSHPRQKADLFSIAFLYAKGGFCANAKARCLGPLESIAPAGATLVASQDKFGMLGSNFLGAVAGHVVTRRALDIAVAGFKQGDPDAGLLTRAFGQVLAEAADLEEALQSNVILDYSCFWPIMVEHAFSPNKYSPYEWIPEPFREQRNAGT